MRSYSWTGKIPKTVFFFFFFVLDNYECEIQTNEDEYEIFIVVLDETVLVFLRIRDESCITDSNVRVTFSFSSRLLKGLHDDDFIDKRLDWAQWILQLTILRENHRTTLQFSFTEKWNKDDASLNIYFKYIYSVSLFKLMFRYTR